MRPGQAAPDEQSAIRRRLPAPGASMRPGQAAPDEEIPFGILKTLKVLQ